MRENRVHLPWVRWMMLIIALCFLCIFYNLLSMEGSDYWIQTGSWQPMDDELFCDGERMSMSSYVQGKWNASGKRFDCSLVKYLKDFGLIGKNYETVDRFTPEDVTFVTYASSNHYGESRRSLMTLRAFCKNKIIYYDLGLSDSEAAEVKRTCNLEYRKLAVGKYPNFTEELFHYHFKPIIIAEVYKTEKVFWVTDTSVRFFNKTLLLEHYEKVMSGNRTKMSQGHPSSHSIYATTRNGTFDYLPIDQNVSFVSMLDANTILVVKSPFSREAIKWNVLCALTDDCMSPPGNQLGCNFDTDRYTKDAQCHRYDQSSISIILTNLRERDGYGHLGHDEDIFKDFTLVERGASYGGPMDLSKC